MKKRKIWCFPAIIAVTIKVDLKSKERFRILEWFNFASKRFSAVLRINDIAGLVRHLIFLGGLARTCQQAGVSGLTANEPANELSRWWAAIRTKKPGQMARA